MKELSAWILSIAGVVVLGVLVDLIVPEGRTQKYIKGIFGIVTVFVIVAPLPSLIKADLKFDFSGGAGSVVDGSYIYSEYKRKVGVMEDAAALELKKEGYAGAAVSITVDSYTENMTVLNVYVNIRDAVIAEDKRHIDKYSEVKRIVSEYLNVGGEKIIVYG